VFRLRSQVYPNGTTLGKVHGAQLGCYMPSGPQDIVDFVTFFIANFGRAAVEKYVVIQFDNEPEWWPVQHQDVHPDPYSYDEVWNKTSAHALALKAAYPNVKIAGFVMGGWAGLWCSGVDGASISNSWPSLPPPPVWTGGRTGVNISGRGCFNASTNIKCALEYS
jgi:hypothetical protein